MLPPPVVSMPYAPPVALPLSGASQVYRRYDANATLQNIAPCALTRSDYDRLRLMVDKQVLSQMPVTDARMVTVDLPNCLTDTYLPLPETIAPSRVTRPWMHSSAAIERHRVLAMPQLRHKLSSSVRVNPVFCLNVLMETLPTAFFCSLLWLYLFYILGVKSPLLTAIYQTLHVVGPVS